MMTKTTPPPMVQSGQIKFAAKIDYVTIKVSSKTVQLPDFDGVPKWGERKDSSGLWTFTIHDPTRRDIIKLVEAFRDPLLWDIEVAVDLSPKAKLTLEERKAFLRETFLAVAGRFRPEDASLWGYGSRGAVIERRGKVEPLERRQASPGEQVIYGGRREFMQAKLYYKVSDQDAPLPPEQHVVRMELHLKRGACIDDEIGLTRMSDLLGYKYRATFAKHFRIILEPDLRNAKSLSPAEAKKRTQVMWRAWSKAGVAKFPDGEHPEDFPKETFKPQRSLIKKRRRAQVAQGHYKLMRDLEANRRIGHALSNLERRMSDKPKKIRATKTT